MGVGAEVAIGARVVSGVGVDGFVGSGLGGSLVGEGSTSTLATTLASGVRVVDGTEVAVGEIDAAMGAGVGLDGDGVDGMAVGGTAVGGTAVAVLGDLATGCDSRSVLSGFSTDVDPHPMAIINISARIANLRNMAVNPLFNLSP